MHENWGLGLTYTTPLCFNLIQLMSVYKRQKVVAICHLSVVTTSMRVQLIRSGACGDCLAPAASLPLIVLSRLLQSRHTWPVVWNELVKVLGQVTACPEPVRGFSWSFEPNTKGCLQQATDPLPMLVLSWLDMIWHDIWRWVASASDPASLTDVPTKLSKTQSF